MEVNYVPEYKLYDLHGARICTHDDHIVVRKICLQ